MSSVLSPTEIQPDSNGKEWFLDVIYVILHCKTNITFSFTSLNAKCFRFFCLLRDSSHNEDIKWNLSSNYLHYGWDRQALMLQKYLIHQMFCHEVLFFFPLHFVSFVQLWPVLTLWDCERTLKPIHMSLICF